MFRIKYYQVKWNSFTLNIPQILFYTKRLFPVKNTIPFENAYIFLSSFMSALIP